MPTSAQLRPVLTAHGDRYTVAAIVVQETPVGGAAELTELASRLADEARRLLLQERPGSTVTAAVAVSSPADLARADLPAAVGTRPAARSGDIEVDRRSYRASADGQPLELSHREFELLAFLVEHPGRVFSRRQLVSSVWDEAPVGTRTVDVHVRRLRMKLGPAADRITTVRNVGYRLEPVVDRDLETVA